MSNMFANRKKIEQLLLNLKRVHTDMGKISLDSEMQKLWRVMEDVLNKTLTDDHKLEKRLMVYVKDVDDSITQIKELAKKL